MVATLDNPETPTAERSAQKAKRRLRLSPRAIRAGAAGTAAAAVLAAGAIWISNRDGGPTPAEQLRRGLVLLDAENSQLNREQIFAVARRLENLEYRHPDFAGGVEFLLGVVIFREAEQADPSDRQRLYETAVRYLQEAAQRALPEDRRAEWAYALGISMHRTGRFSDAQPLLEEAQDNPAEMRIPVVLALTEIYLDLKTTALLKQALELSAGVLAGGQVSENDRVQLHLLRAQVLLALDRSVELERELELLQQTAWEEYDSQGTVVFRAQALMAGKQFDEALELLQQVTDRVGLDEAFPRQAAFLTGVAHEAMGRVDDAISAYSRTAERYAESNEGLAANLRMADLLRAGKKHEQARDAYRRALRMVDRPRDFRNRWITLDEFRKRIRTAWREWCRDDGYAWAIDLCKETTPLLPQVEARRLEAGANQLWAEHLEQEYQTAPVKQRTALEKQLRQRWQASGRAFGELAESLMATSQYPDALWVSADHYDRGHDLEQALAQITRFINTRPKKRLPQAIVRRGRMLMDLERLDEAQDHFQRVIDNHSSDPTVFEARFLQGACHLERDEPDLAEKVWRKILTSDVLKPGRADIPGAKEWQQALFALGRLQFLRAEMQYTASERLDEAGRGAAEELPENQQQAFARWNECRRRMEEFLERYPHDHRTVEARYLLAKSLQRRAELPAQKLASAETDNARQELRRSMNVLLNDAVREFRTLQDELLKRDADDRLDDLGRRVLRDSFFEVAHTLSALQKYKDAIDAYSAAANRFPEDPHVLLAYLQMSNCYEQLDKPQESRSMLEQAKVIISQLPEEVFRQDVTNLSRQEWDGWLDWSRQLNQPAPTQQLAAP